MKAIALVRYGQAKDAFQIVDREIPKHGDDEVLIEVEGFGINFADVMARQGVYREAPPLPAILGYEVVGRIAKIGSKITQVKIGDRVVALTRFGGYAEYACVKELACAVIDESIPLAEATALATQFCTAHLIIEKKLHLKKDELILIHAAAGGVGLALLQLAKLRQAKVIALVGSDEKRALVESFGADFVINSRKEDFAKAVEKQFGKNAVDYVCDSIGGKTFRKGFKLLKPTGTIVGFGSAETAKHQNALIAGIKLLLGFGFFSPAFLVLESRSMIGLNVLRFADLRPDLIQDCLQAVVGLHATKKLTAVGGGEYPFDQVARAHDALESRKTTGKLCIRVKALQP